MPSFLAVRHDRDGKARLTRVQDADLAPDGVELAVSHSAISRADAQAATGTRTAGDLAIVPGMDLAGIVTASDDARWRPGDAVIATGRGLGRSHHGGWAERARIPGDWLMAQPAGMSAARAMAIGTAGLAAMEATLELDYHGALPESGPVLVTGASGGVGSLAIVALTAIGFSVTGATSRPSAVEYLRTLGASEVITVSGLGDTCPLDPERWAAAVDVLGGPALSCILPSLLRSGAVAVVGDVAGEWLKAHLDAFTQRGVALLGVNAVDAPHSRRREAWERWSDVLQESRSASRIELLTTRIRLADVPGACRALLAGELQGRVVVEIGSTQAEALPMHH